jgi:hypothetical protein
MIAIEVVLTLETDAAARTPEVRAWIDLRPELGLDSEIELPLAHRDARHWIGLFTVADASHYFLYRIEVAADPATVWSLAVRRRDRARALLWDADRLDLPKLWLAGTCDLSA